MLIWSHNHVLALSFETLSIGVGVIIGLVILRQILAMDEITAPTDVQAAEEAVGCGVQLLATAHAAWTADFQTRPLYRRLIEDKVFKNAVTITLRDGRRYYTREALK